LSNSGKGISIDQSQVGEEDSHKDGAPNELIDSNLDGNVLAVCSWNLFVKPIVEIMSAGSMIDETKDGERNITLPVEASSGNKDLSAKKAGGNTR
jgi:hypothetical protein